jgi:hypothetical protein
MSSVGFFGVVDQTETSIFASSNQKLTKPQQSANLSTKSGSDTGLSGQNLDRLLDRAYWERNKDRKAEQGSKTGYRAWDRFTSRKGFCFSTMSCLRSCLSSLKPVLLSFLKFSLSSSLSRFLAEKPVSEPVFSGQVAETR